MADVPLLFASHPYHRFLDEAFCALGLLESLRKQGKSESAYWVQREFERAWSGADIQLKLGEL